MQVFSRRGFQLRTASVETRVAYTAFLVLSALGLATLVALAMRAGTSPSAIAVYYRGDDSEMSFGKTFWQLVETSHFHLFTVPVVVLIWSHLLYGTPTSVRLRVGLTLVTFAGALLEALGPWLVRYVAGACAWVLMAGWLLLAGGAAAILVISLLSMWGREWMVKWFASPQEGSPP
ncbi:MAG TPA: hypothetical protein VMJ10_22365 [Kofleriaceae bacterium]|nr:hypothetical protein [Kofleriaceae bacterium]